MDRNRQWMYESKGSEVYNAGVLEFLNFAFCNIEGGVMWCPCRKCVNRCKQRRNDMHFHLLKYGILRNYHIWVHQGEVEQTESIEGERNVREKSNCRDTRTARRVRRSHTVSSEVTPVAASYSPDTQGSNSGGVKASTHDIPTSSTRRQKPRGQYTGRSLIHARHDAGATLIAQVDVDTYRVVGEHHAHFASEIGRTARECYPLDKGSYCKLPRNIQESVVPFIRRIFSFEPYLPILLSDEDKQNFDIKVSEMIMRHAGHLWGVYRSRLNNALKECETEDERIEIKPQRCTDEEWATFIRHCDSDDFQAVSDRNSTSRAQQDISFISGRTSFFQVKHAKEEASTIMADAGEQGMDPLPNPREVMTRVLRFRTGHVRGKGWGPLPEPMRHHEASSSSSDGHSHQVEVLRNELELVKTQHMEEIEAMKTQYNEVKTQLAYLMNKFGGSDQ